MGVMNDDALRMAEHLRFVMETRVPEVSENPKVTGAGMAWRDGMLKFVVQTDKIGNVSALKAELPSTIEDFPTTVEVASLPIAASADDIELSPSRRRGFWSRTFGGIFTR